MKERRSLKAIAVTLFCFLLLGAEVYAQGYDKERILSFHSLIKIHQDSSMTVTETIKVKSTGSQIKHGIYRDFPTRYNDRYGNKYSVGFQVIQVLRDGESESYHFKDLVNGKRVYMGKKDFRLPTGVHTYTLVYKTNRQLGFFKDYDELYWNVTGNGWSFPIDEVIAEVRLPEGVQGKIIDLDAYTGRAGSKEKSFVASKDISATATFTVTRPLLAQEGFTIVVSWPKGYVTEPDMKTKIGYLLLDNRSVIVGLLGLIGLLLFYLVVWNRFGKDPSKGVIIPLYNPPDKLSPAAMRYIMKMGFDNKILAATIINMAVKGYVKIYENAGIYTVQKTGANESALTPEELTVSRHLLGHHNEIALKKENHQEVSGTISNLRLALERKFEKVYFFTNKQYFIIGSAISIVIMILSVLALGISEKLAIAMFMGVWLTFWSFGVLMLLKQVISLWKEVLSGGSGKRSVLGIAVFLSLFSIPFVVGELFGLGMFVYATSPLVAAIMACVVFINALFYHLLKAPTLAGRKTMDKIEGFKMYLGVAEKDRLNLLNPPEKTPELFERYLPYAFALDVEQVWSEQFSQLLQQTAQEEEYRPGWYSGATLPTAGTAGLISGLGSSVSNAISSSSVAPGSRSGGFGGGGSGGGGGGGGGGGW